MNNLPTWQTLAAIRKLKELLVKLNVKSARDPDPVKLTTGANAIIKINGKPVAYTQGVSYVFNNSSPIPIVGSDD